MNTVKKQAPLESTIQKSCVTWFRFQYPRLRQLLFSVPNGAHLNGNSSQRAIQMNKMKREGLNPGVSDLILLIPSDGYFALCIEMKRPIKKSKQSVYQKNFELAVTQQGYRYAICRSLEEFKQLIDNYLNPSDGDS